MERRVAPATRDAFVKLIIIILRAGGIIFVVVAVLDRNGLDSRITQ